MSTEFSMLGIMNAALLAQGQEEVLAAGDGTVEWRMLFRNWPLIVEAELEVGKYQFTRHEKDLVTRAPGRFGFDDAYLVPSDALHVRRLWYTDECGNRILPDWIQDSSFVYVDQPSGVTIEYAHAPDAHLWSASFALGVKYRLEALIAGGIKEESGEKEMMNAAADEQFSIARTSSSQERAARPPYRKGALSRARGKPRAY